MGLEEMEEVGGLEVVEKIPKSSLIRGDLRPYKMVGDQVKLKCNN